MTMAKKTSDQRAGARSLLRARALRAFLVVGLVLGLVGIGILTMHAPPHGPGPSRHQEEPDVVVGGLEESGRTLGLRDAPVTLQYFADLASYDCRVFTFAVLPGIIEKWVRTGKLKVEYRALGAAPGGPSTVVAANQQLAALAAGQQNKLWYFADLFWYEQEPHDVTLHFIEHIAKRTPGLDLNQWRKAREDPGLAREIVSDAVIAKDNDVKSVPALLIGRTGSGLRRLRYRSLRDRHLLYEEIERFVGKSKLSGPR